jgi:hypothetical protein
MNVSDITVGLTVRVARLEDTTGMLIAEKHLSVRRLGAVGEITGYVAGHGGDVWWVHHWDTDQVGAYIFTEIEPYRQED